MSLALTFLLTLVSQNAPVAGPGQLCLKYSSFVLAPGEQVAKRAIGIEGMQLEIDGPSGRYTIVEGELMGGPKSRDRRVQTRPDAQIYALDAGGYAFRGTLPFSLHGQPLAEPVDQFYVSIRGRALDRHESARLILSRLTLGTPKTADCLMRYQYGWEFFLPAETQ